MLRLFTTFTTLSFAFSTLTLLAGCEGEPSATGAHSQALEDAAPLVVMAVAKVKAGTEADFKEAALALVSGTRQEPGNIAYVLHQAKDDPTQFGFYERWTTPEAFDAHMHGVVLDRFFQRVSTAFEPGFPQITQYLEVDSEEPAEPN